MLRLTKVAAKSTASAVEESATSLGGLCRFNDEMSAYGLGITDSKSPEFQAFLTYYFEQKAVAHQNIIKQRSREWMQLLETDHPQWIQHLVKTSESESWFAREPVFQLVSANEMADTLFKLPTPTIREVLRVFTVRYEHTGEHTLWRLEELPFLRLLHKKLTQKSKKRLAEVSLAQHSVKSWFLPALQKIINELSETEERHNTNHGIQTTVN